ncbi:hypothetical protein [Actinocatenispora comari]|uniref:Uncharacterized protein n=1 Tax=Actinocatenispora comari TaxID=2807577 RepID=A0A8J4A4Y9_9ACTN|nr:hypothetical protein [Actinocatenispora comari]GIL25079.1 hypothetical protein NUM_03340 [Actinocatenispora comari]
MAWQAIDDGSFPGRYRSGGRRDAVAGAVGLVVLRGSPMIATQVEQRVRRMLEQLGCRPPAA